MRMQWKVLLLVSVSALVSACATPKSYVDPQYRKATYETVHRLAQPLPVKLEAQFQRNGTPLPSVNSELRGHVERTLRASGIFVPSDQGATRSISVTANNIADMSAAVAKGFGTGLTFGLVGSMVDDNYEFTFQFDDGAKHTHRAVYRHAIHTAIGNTDGPAGLTPTSPADAFGRVVDDAVLNFLQELQERRLVMDASEGLIGARE